MAIDTAIVKICMTVPAGTTEEQITEELRGILEVGSDPDHAPLFAVAEISDIDTEVIPDGCS